MEQVAWRVMVFNATVKVSKWLAMIKTRNKILAAVNSSRPKGPIKTSPASAILEI